MNPFYFVYLTGITKKFNNAKLFTVDAGAAFYQITRIVTVQLFLQRERQVLEKNTIRIIIYSYLEKVTRE